MTGSATFSGLASKVRMHEELGMEYWARERYYEKAVTIFTREIGHPAFIERMRHLKNRCLRADA